jgi:ArsR family transcriptional regulator
MARLADELKMLSDKTRLTILAYLQVRSLCVCEIVELLDSSQPNVSQHLRKLKAAGLVQESRKGQWVYYHLTLTDKPHIAAILEQLSTDRTTLPSLTPLHKLTSSC